MGHGPIMKNDPLMEVRSVQNCGDARVIELLPDSYTPSIGLTKRYNVMKSKTVMWHSCLSTANITSQSLPSGQLCPKWSANTHWILSLHRGNESKSVVLKKIGDFINKRGAILPQIIVSKIVGRVIGESSYGDLHHPQKLYKQWYN